MTEHSEEDDTLPFGHHPWVVGGDVVWRRSLSRAREQLTAAQKTREEEGRERASLLADLGRLSDMAAELERFRRVGSAKSAGLVSEEEALRAHAKAQDSHLASLRRMLDEVQRRTEGASVVSRKAAERVYGLEEKRQLGKDEEVERDQLAAEVKALRAEQRAAQRSTRQVRTLAEALLRKVTERRAELGRAAAAKVELEIVKEELAQEL
eukprot:Hpha_TRINITY_DN31895_c0_g1::TRINITY_DN31895_c0_g1_i1::g.29938::m.29938